MNDCLISTPVAGEDALYCSVGMLNSPLHRGTILILGCYITGYCFGGPFTTDLAATDKVVAAAFAHPAFLTEDQFRKVKSKYRLGSMYYFLTDIL